MRVPVIIVLIAALLTQSLSKGIIVLSYFTNKRAYERYCVNKARPQLHCDGKCQMAKKIKAEEERDQKDPLKSTASETVLILQDHFVRIQPVYLPLALKVNIFPYAIGHTRDMSRSCFHPPNLG
ncbi:hypothetical protein [Taibaiella helva]|uniref:hypothetical protein n=1 Tax=Taibaiella helva TaxID=2301235 RepID=UPI00130025AF|nr:hypothetical protein [Taibaiella helva]